MTKLQLALDADLPSALRILSDAHAHIDIAEIGTPLVFREGMRALRRIREAFPQLTLMADLKIMDAGRAEADIAFSAGADLVTVMAAAADATIAGALESARSHEKRVMVDMMQIAHPRARALELVELGCDLLCLHTAHDQQASQASPFAQLADLRGALPAAGLAIAGGVKLADLDRILPLRPQVIIVGSAITGAADPQASAEQFFQRIREYGHTGTD
ncbi:MAG: orotidine 5'-phosphate decarboxylase [Chloroflexota bacterium]|nr:orotidine 5'-phosphate decarboxylase [Chloroflexota bacterium]MDE2948967.1 orotidine 5'-phosphate decarboxylase [Chloroflexota bacterium]